jgi:hypothetical protein
MVDYYEYYYASINAYLHELINSSNLLFNVHRCNKEIAIMLGSIEPEFMSLIGWRMSLAKEELLGLSAQPAWIGGVGNEESPHINF